ncbi:SDR family NAD(P)-dependent oxidoreductase [Novosphingobium sp. M1R2S20]|uniref:SDR family NAD(P)-dependent oxidoreductase n=1 Tax=Novosphingobium rhizovicinum TaxID=3228928 RepID=A0ABV3RGC3_9SPHN
MAESKPRKVAVVTGGSSGIGRASALAFASAGYAVGILDRSEEGGRAVAQSLQERGTPSHFASVDVEDNAATGAAIDAIVSALGGLDAAFNAAGIDGEPGKRVHECTADNWARVIGIDLTGVWHCMRHQLQHMLAAGGGAIVNCSSAAGLVGAPTYAAYSAAKHGVIGLTKSAALEYARDNIRINAVCPGMTDTAMTREGDKEALFDQLVAQSPLGRRGLPEEIAAAAVWLCSEEASFVTGIAMPVDGGHTVG